MVALYRRTLCPDHRDGASSENLFPESSQTAGVAQRHIMFECSWPSSLTTIKVAEWHSTLAAVVESDSEQEEAESVNAELGQETLLPDGDLPGFASDALPTQSLDSTHDQRLGSSVVALHRRPISLGQVVSTDCEQNLDPHHGKEGFLAQVTHG